MSKWGFAVGVAFVLGGACNLQEDQFPDSICPETVTSCRVVSGFGGYQRACSTSCTQQSVQPNRGKSDDDDEDGDSSAEGTPMAMTTPAAASMSEGSGENLGAAGPLDLRRYSAFDMPCERDNQCGPGKCKEGNCYYGCHSDSQCGSGDRCSVESGVRVCQPDPNPPVECTRSAQCDDGFTCLNGACRQTCTATAQCTNVLDRCGSGVCVPDRRPLGECVLNNECAEGLVCLDGSCVPACPNGEDRADGGACLAEPASAAPSSSPSPSEPPVTVPLAPSEGDPAEEPSSEEPGDGEGTEDETPEDTGEPPAETGPDAGAPISTIR